MSQDEREHLQRQRDRQLAARDPGSSKIRGYDWAKHTEKARQHKPKPFFQDLRRACLAGGEIQAVVNRSAPTRFSLAQQP